VDLGEGLVGFVLIISAALIGLMYYVLKTAAEYITKQDDKEKNRKLAKKEE
jgi:hypothetical protein